MGSDDSSIERAAKHPPLTGLAPEYHLTLLETPLPVVSLMRQIREEWREPKFAAPPDASALPVSDMRPWYRDLPGEIRSLFEASKPPAMLLSSRPMQVPEIWRDFQPHPASWGNALLAHVLAVTAMILPFALKNMLTPVQIPKRSFELTKIFLPTGAVGEPPRGGGGGGDRTRLPASRGAIPRFARVQFAPPRAKLPVVPPVLPVEPTLVGAPELKLPEMTKNLPWGEPAGVLGTESNGPGSGDGIGPGNGSGVGPGEGPGYGPGRGGSYGGGNEPVYGAGLGVTAPVPLFKPEPAYSEEARKAKYQGNVTLWIIVGPQGNVTDGRVVKPLGMGLDEKALEAVRTWRFRPGLRNNIPVAVRMLVEVSFRLF